MELVEPSQQHEHKWLEWLGLEERPPEPDTWEPIARAFHLDGPDGSTSTGATRLVALLKSAGIEAQQRTYQWDNSEGVGYLVPTFTGGGVQTRVAVGVHNRDRERATEIARKFMEEQDAHGEAELPVPDVELAKDADETAPPPGE